MNISVVIPCYNSAAFVARAVCSVIADANVIVVDDGSTDGSIDVLQKFSSGIMLESWPNRGACVARNRGLELVQEPFVMFLDADDYLLPGTLPRLSELLETAGADFAIVPVTDVDADGRSVSRLMPRIDRPANFISDWVAGKFVPPCGILWRTEFVRKVGGWDESLRKNQDGEFVLRAMLNGAKPVQSMTGGGVYWQHTSEDRISSTFSVAKLMDSFSVLTTTRSRWIALDLSDTETEQAFSKATYELQRLAARVDLPEVEREIRAYRRSQGWPCHIGSILHLLFSRLLGLAAKEKLAERLRGGFRGKALSWRQ